MRAIDLGTPDAIDLAWAPAAGNVSSYAVFGSINGGPFQVLGHSQVPRIALRSLGLAFGDELVVRTQAFGADLKHGPYSPSSEPIRFTTNPTWHPLSDQTLSEGESATVPLTAEIVSGASLQLSAAQLPTFARLDDFGDGTGRLILEPRAGDAGVFDIQLDATDLGPPVLRSTEHITVQVTVPPPLRLRPLADRSMRETQTLFIDLEANRPALFRASDLPSFMALGSADGRTTIVARPGYDDGGTHSITVEAEDTANSLFVDTLTFTLTVIELNRPPELDPVGPQSVLRGEALWLDLSASDPDGDSLLFLAAIDGALVTLGARSPSGTARLEIPAAFTQEGDFLLEILVFDESSPALYDTAIEAVSVLPNPGPIAPILAVLADADVVEGGAIDLDVQTINPNAGSYSLSASALPPFASFTDLGNGAGQLSVTPAWGDRGFFDATLTATNDDEPAQSDSQSLRVTVTQARVLTSHEARDEITILDPVTLQETTVHGGLYPLALATGPQGRIFALRGVDYVSEPAVFEIAPETGQAFPVSQGGLLSAAAEGPSALAVADDGLIYVSFFEDHTGGQAPGIIRIDPDTGEQQVVHDGSAPLGQPASIASGPDGRLYVGDTQAAAVIAIDPMTAASAVIAPLSNPEAIANHPSGRLIVSDSRGPVGNGSLWWLDALTGQLELLSDANALGRVSAIAVQAGGQVVTVDRDGPNLVVVDPQDGSQLLVPLSGAGHTGVVVVPAP